MLQGKQYSLIAQFHPAKSVRGRGFTLIEILVTLVLIGIVLGIALLRFDNNDFDSLLKREAGRMARLMELADQQAIYQSQALGMLLKEESYRFLTYNRDNKWGPVEDSLLKPRQLPDGMEMIVNIEGSNADLRTSSENPIPQIVFSNSGEWTAFEIVFTHRENNDITYILNTTNNGELEITRESNELQ